MVDEATRHLLICDLKTWPTTETVRVAAMAARQKVPLQLAHYLAGTLAALAGAGISTEGWTTDAAIIVVEDRPPHDVGVYFLGLSGALAQGERDRRRALESWAHATKTNSYPGRCPGRVDMMLPGWAEDGLDIEEPTQED